MIRLAWMVLVVLTVSTQLRAQGWVERPIWSLHPDLGGFGDMDVSVPSEYEGGDAVLARLQFPARGERLETRLASVRFSPASGVLFVEDRRRANSRERGWDTGHARVLSLRLESDEAHGASFISSVWDAEVR